MMLLEAVLYSFLATIILIFVKIIGSLTYPFFFTKKHQAKYGILFCELIWGLIITISIYAIITMNGQSIFLLIVPILFFKTLGNKERKIEFSIEKKELFNIFLIAISCIIMGVISLLIPLKDVIEQDTLYYVRIGESLHEFKRENIFTFFNENENYNGTFPYHYFDLYIGSILFNIFGNVIPNIILYKHVVFVMIEAILFIGAIAIIECLGHFRWYHTFCIIGFFLCDFTWLSNWISPTYPLTHNFWENPKFAVNSLFVLCFFYFMIIDRKKDALFFLMILPLTSIITAPSIFLGCGVFLLYEILTNSKEKSLNITLLCYFTAIGISILLFYEITGLNYSKLSGEKSNFIENINKTLKMYKAIIGYLCEIFIGISSWLVLPLLGSLYLRKRITIFRNFKELILITFSIASLGIITFQVVAYMHDSFQIAHLGYIMIYWIFGIFTYVLMKQKKKIITILLIIIITPGIVSNMVNFNTNFSNTIANNNLQKKGYDKKAIKSIKAYLNKKKKPIIGGFYYSKNGINKIYISRRFHLVYQKGAELAYLSSNIRLYSITPRDIWDDASLKNFDLHNRVSQFNINHKYYQKGADLLSDRSNVKYINEIINNMEMKFIISDTLTEEINCDLIIKK